MSPRVRVFLAVLFTPLVPQLVIAATALKYDAGHPNRTITIGFLAAAYFLMLACGLPTHLYLKHRRHTRGWDYVSTGAISGILLAILVMVALQLWAFLGVHRAVFTLEELLALAIINALLMVYIMVGFWLIARPDRP